MLKVGMYNTVSGGVQRFQPYHEKYENKLELISFDCPLTYETLEKLKETGCNALIYFNPKRESEDFFRKIALMGIQYLVTPSAGYDHFNLEAMKKYGIRGANVPVYSPSAISEHTILLTLSVLRNYREQLLRLEKNKYGITGLMGRELHHLTIGIIGTGRIGSTTIRVLSGFSPRKMLACSPHEKPELKNLVTYVDLDTLYSQSDIIIFHCAASKENYHMVNQTRIDKLKKVVILINTARGSLFENQAVLNALETGQIGGLGIDVIEGEEKLRGIEQAETCPLPELAELLKHKNVVYTRHTAFFTDEAYRNMTETIIDNLLEYARTDQCRNELVTE